LGLRNIELLRKRSDDGFEDFRTRGESFDIILIDGNHGYEQCVKDLRNALSLLKQTGFIILHDTYCQEWPGVALAVDTLQQENLAIDKVALPLWPGIAILQKTRPITMIRRISSEENKQVNEWRRHAGITTRPLPDGDDPRPEETFEDSRIGLFAVLCDGKLAGGFGVRSRTFRQAGEDDFAPDGEGPLSGFLVYGAVLRPEVHGLGVHDFVQRELLRWFGSTGYYAITEFPKETVSIASSEIVGRAGDYRAYHVRPFYASDKPLFSLFRRLRIMHSERRLKLEVADLTRAVTEKDRRNEDLQQKLAAEAQRANEEIADLRRAVTEKDVRNEDLQQKLAAETQRANEEIADLRQELMRIQRSRSWRWTTALRGIAGFLRRCIFYLQSRHAWK
jgi:hypothetical protein